MVAQPPEVARCRFCEGAPAADVTFRGFRGIFIVYRWQRARGPMCRDCGTAMFRYQSGVCLRLGWWAIWSIVANPVFLLRNYLAFRKIRRLGPAVRPLGNAPLKPETPLLHQPVALIATSGYLVVVAVLVTLGIVQQTTPFTPDQRALIGTCVAQQADGSYAESACGQANTFRVISLAHDTSSCPTGTTAITLEGTPITQAVVLCVAATS